MNLTWFRQFSAHKEILLVFLILCVLSMIIIPIPHQIMDVLIALNIAFTVIVLMVVIYMQSPLELTAFPSILLVLALFRIGITISTSRLILLDGDAGQIVRTFGEFVVSGNLIVGIIIFSMITLINFIVITKGSERVAEVAARFSLDAMPGKQMSIDSDLRAGNIEMAEAQRRRNALGLESKLYGAMDGAMKFVKGDAIASMLDIVINLLGGLAVGMLQHSMGFNDALITYSILTVGDGLVQQIPSLLISMTAGMMITRVSDDDQQHKENLGTNIINQLFKNPKALVAAASLFVILTMLPGMPSGIFVVLIVLLLSLALYLFTSGNKTRLESSSANDQIIEEREGQDEQISREFISWKLQALVLNLAPNLKTPQELAMIKRALNEVRRDILINLGVEIPAIIIRYLAELPLNSYQLQIFEIPASSGCFYPNSILLSKIDSTTLSALGIKETIPNQVIIERGDAGGWIDQQLAPRCDEFGIGYLSIEQFLTLHMSKVLKENIAEFFGMQEVKDFLDKIEEYQDLIRELLRMLPLNKLTEVLQRLLTEGISIRNFKMILNSMLEWSQREKEVIIICEYVRQALGRYLAYKYSEGSYIIPCFLLDNEIEDVIRDSIRFNERGSYLAIDPNLAASLVERLRTLMQTYVYLKIVPVILTQMDVRRYVRSIVEKELPFLAVLSFQEVEAHAKFNSLEVVDYFQATDNNFAPDEL